MEKCAIHGTGSLSIEYQKKMMVQVTRQRGHIQYTSLTHCLQGLHGTHQHGDISLLPTVYTNESLLTTVEHVFCLKTANTLNMSRQNLTPFSWISWCLGHQHKVISALQETHLPQPSVDIISGLSKDYFLQVICGRLAWKRDESESI